MSSHHHHYPKYLSRDGVNEAENKLKREFRIKCKFRAWVRKVIANSYWLIEGIDAYEGLEDVKRRVAQAVRGKKKQDLLSISDKALLNKPAADRSDQERQYLFKIIGGLKCFKRYPNHVKRKLAAVTYFQYYGPGRTIIRQHQEAHALYFIIAGSVVVSQTVYDELLHQDVSMQIGDLRSGDMFGEISLLHNITRTATVTTTEHCELLQLMKSDFKTVLQYSIQREWDEVLRAMSSFTYFEALDDVSKREGCLLAQLKSFQPNETVYGDGMGVPNFVYFLLSGQCQMIESLRIRIKKRNGKKHYSLFDPYIPPTGNDVENAENNLKSLFARYADKFKELETIEFSSSRAGTKSDVHKHSVYYVPANLGNAHSTLEMHTKLLGSQNERRRSLAMDSNVRYSIGNQKSIGDVLSRTLDTMTTDVDAKSATKVLMNPESSADTPISGAQSPPTYANDAYITKTVFMQVCVFNAGSCFCLGEDHRDRRIIALKKADCMLLPKVWLLQRNTINIWTRIQHYMEKKLPTKKMMFKDFLEGRRWAEYRKKVVSEVTSKSKSVNYTTIHDVPYSIRLEEMEDSDDMDH